MQPVPPPTPIPNAVKFPTIEIALPSYELPKWEPVQIYKEDIKSIKTKQNPENKAVKTKGKPNDTEQTTKQSKINEPKKTQFPKTAQELEVDKKVARIEVPILGDIPVPKEEILVTAVATAGAAAVASVGGTLLATRLFEQIMKLAQPVLKKLAKRLLTAQGKAPASTWGRQRLAERRRRLGKNYWTDAT